MADKRRVARRLTEQEIVEKSTITDDDVARARAWWKTHVPTNLRDLIDANVKDSGK